MAKIKAKVYLPTKDWKEKEKTEITITSTEFDGKNDIEYSANIPSYIFDLLTSEQGGMLNYQEFNRRANAQAKHRHSVWQEKLALKDQYLKKQIKSTLISSIISEIEELGHAAAFIVNKQKLDKKKKLFVSFKPNSFQDSCNWTGGAKGRVVSSSFQFFVGYEIIEPKNKLSFSKEERKETVPRYYTYIRRSTGSTAHLDTGGEEGLESHPLHKSDENSRKEFVNKYRIIEWNQDRENFFKKVENKFESLNNELSKFLLDLDDAKVDHLIESGLKLLGDGEN